MGSNVKDNISTVLLCSPMGRTGGISSWTNHILNHYRKCGTENIRLLFCNELSEVSHFPLSKSRFLRGILTYFPFVFKVFKKLSQEKGIDIIHLCSSASYGLLRDIIILFWARLFGVKLILHFHFGRIPQLFMRKNWECRLIKFLSRHANTVIVMDSESYNALHEAGMINVFFLPNPLSDSFLHIQRLHFLSSDTDYPTILFVGNVIESKGVLELVSACQAINSIRLRLVGKYSQGIKEKILFILGDRPHEWLTLVGCVPIEEVIEEMLSCDIFALPSYTEGFPNVILEAMACGCPIVSTNVGAIPEMLAIRTSPSEQCGICVEPKDVNMLREAILNLLQKPQYASDLGRQAQIRVRDVYSIHRVWHSLTKIWQET